MLNLILIQSNDHFMLHVIQYFTHSHGTSEIALLTLQEAYSLFVLLYASPALTFQCRQIGELNACNQKCNQKESLDINEVSL